MAVQFQGPNGTILVFYGHQKFRMLAWIQHGKRSCSFDLGELKKSMGFSVSSKVCYGFLRFAAKTSMIRSGSLIKAEYNMEILAHQSFCKTLRNS